MIISHINGGLGNQLFQYAAGRSLASFYNVPFKIDRSYYDNVKFRAFDLTNLNTHIDYASYDEIKKALSRSIFYKAFSKLYKPHQKKIFIAPYFHFYNHFFKASSQAILSGLWQSEKYFISIEDIIRKEFTVKDELIQHLKQKAQTMSQENSVSVHIRRGDYEDPRVVKVMGLLPLTYYQQALSLVLQKAGDVKIYFFSDDINFVKKNFVLNNSAEFISGELTKNHVEDFYLMQHCRHNIIANSTFSWWCAWLNGHVDKIVVAPQKWFSDELKNAKDLIPDSWCKI